MNKEETQMAKFVYSVTMVKLSENDNRQQSYADNGIVEAENFNKASEIVEDRLRVSGIGEVVDLRITKMS